MKRLDVFFLRELQEKIERTVFFITVPWRQMRRNRCGDRPAGMAVVSHSLRSLPESHSVAASSLAHLLSSRIIPERYQQLIARELEPERR